MHLHFLGICGTFMGSLALLAREMGHEVSGCDENIYPPMSTQLEAQGIAIYSGYGIQQFEAFPSGKPDQVIIGNALSRGNPAVEYVLDKHVRYCSGPQWLSEHVLSDKWVLAVAGTHGKTTTTAMLTWILEQAGYEPGYLIGGVPQGFECSARLGNSDFFVIEADEYDTAFFDKRSKFVHYHPRTLVLNNLEYDHADIFPDLAAIQRQFHHVVRLVPSVGLVVSPHQNSALSEVLDQGCWSESIQWTLVDSKPSAEPPRNWSVRKLNEEASEFEILHVSKKSDNPSIQRQQLSWSLIGDHNMHNAMSACIAAAHVGVPLSESLKALASFKNVKRRMEHIYSGHTQHGHRLDIYDDFAHHPTAIKTSLAALRAKIKHRSLIALVDPKSNSMKMDVHGDRLIQACEDADQSYWFVSHQKDKQRTLFERLNAAHCMVFEDIDKLAEKVMHQLQQSDKDVAVVLMSNGSFSSLPEKLLHLLKITKT